jgi:hypothetical protein
MTAFVSYAEVTSEGQAGHVAASSSGYTGRTLVRATDAAVNCALAVCPGVTPGKTCKVPTTAAEARACEGILLDPVYLNEIGAVATSYAAGQPATVLEEGYLWVNSEGTVAANDPVFVRHTSDGGSNLTRGTLTNTSDVVAGGVVITPGGSLTAAVTTFSVTLGNGSTQETFVFTSDASPTAAEVSVGLVALIDASANFAATGTVTISVTSSTGIVEVIGLAGGLTVTTPARCERLKGARWHKARTGAGLTKVRLQLRQD